ncbi:MAG: T9SS type A sorting domain-containing protein, partial [Candidatus Eisenbacteria bacterium]|nr:T9SS type A sorting domain-containing protein [Candidatus Eisenbacteria bacterium]
EYHSLYVTEVMYSYDGEDPGDPDWTLGVPGDQATTGIWERVDPIGTEYNGTEMQPEDDHTPDPGTECFVTGNGPVGGGAGENDVDDGCTTLESPTFDLSEAEFAFVTYWRWYGEGGNSADDEFVVDVSSDGGTNWYPLERVENIANDWNQVNLNISDFVDLTNQVKFRFIACDLNTPGLTEAAIDDFAIEVFSTSPPSDAPEVVEVPRTRLTASKPNPFVPAGGATLINFRLSNPAHARLEIYDTSGRLVRTLVDKPLQSGAHEIAWDGRDAYGNEVTSGIYFYSLEAGAFKQSRRLTVLK